MRTHQPNPKKENRLRQVLHKLSDAAVKALATLRSTKVPTTELLEQSRELAVGRTFRFDGSETAYLVTVTGGVRRVDPKPWKNKAERKRHLRERRQDREELRQKK
jgi:hypothetical protein